MDKAPLQVQIKTLVQTKIEKSKVRYQIYQTGVLSSDDSIKLSTLQQLQNALPQRSDFIQNIEKITNSLYLKFRLNEQFYLLQFQQSGTGGYYVRCLFALQSTTSPLLDIPRFSDILAEFLRVCQLTSLKIKTDSCKIRQINVLLNIYNGKYRSVDDLIRSPNDYFGGIVKLKKGAEAIHIAGSTKQMEGNKQIMVWQVQILNIDFENMIQSIGECLDTVFVSWGE